MTTIPILGDLIVTFPNGQRIFAEQNIGYNFLPDGHADGLGALITWETTGNILKVKRERTPLYTIDLDNIRGFYSRVYRSAGSSEFILEFTIYTTSHSIPVINFDINSTFVRKIIGEIDKSYGLVYVLPYNHRVKSISSQKSGSFINTTFATNAIVQPIVNFELSESAFNNTISSAGLNVVDMQLDTNNQIAGNAMYIEYKPYPKRPNGSTPDVYHLEINMKQTDDTYSLSISNNPILLSFLKCQKTTMGETSELAGDYITAILAKYTKLIIKISNGVCYLSHNFGPFIAYNLDITGVLDIKNVKLLDGLITKFSVFSLPDNRLVDCIIGTVEYGDGGLRCTDFMKRNYCAWNNDYNDDKLDCAVTNQMTSCIGGECVRDIYGTTTLAECTPICKKMYSCNNGKCVEDPNGTTLVECEKACGSSSWYLWIILIFIVISIVGFYVTTKSTTKSNT